MNTPVQALAAVPFLSPLDPTELDALAQASHRERYRAGSRLMSELEFGADVFVLLSGRAQVSVEPRRGQVQVLGTLEAGGAVGEMSSLTGELRSATVTALDDVEVLRIPDAVFDALRVRKPEVAVALVRMLSRRLAEAEGLTESLLAAPHSAPPAEVKGATGRRGSIARAWRELVTSRGKDLAFLALVAFGATLLLVRGAVHLAFRLDWAPREVLRLAYSSGFLLLIGAACASLFTFRPGVRRVLALCYGVALALIVNELGVTLAFDIFYKDIHTPDPTVAFDVERLYRRAEPLRAIALAFVVLVQAAYLRGFYRRVGFVVATRLRGLMSRRA